MDLHGPIYFYFFCWLRMFFDHTHRPTFDKQRIEMHRNQRRAPAMLTGDRWRCFQRFRRKIAADGPFKMDTLLVNLFLVGGLEHEFYDFPFSWECHDPNWLRFFRGVGLNHQPAMINHHVINHIITYNNHILTIHKPRVFFVWVASGNFERSWISWIPAHWCPSRCDSPAAFASCANGNQWKWK